MNRRFLMLSATLATAIAVSPVSAQAPEAAPSDDPVAYFLGVSIGQQMASQGFRGGDFNLNVMARGLRDALEGKEPALNQEQLQQAQQRIQAMLTERETEKQAQQKQQSSQWLAANAEKEGVKTLEGGVQYKVLESGDGASPSASDTVRVHYTGRLTSGEVFDSSVERGEPASFQVGRVIKGWQMALQEMQVGDKWMLYIPPDLAYGERGAPPRIGPNEVLIFEVELLDIL